MKVKGFDRCRQCRKIVRVDWKPAPGRFFSRTRRRCQGGIMGVEAPDGSAKRYAESLAAASSLRRSVSKHLCRHLNRLRQVCLKLDSGSDQSPPQNAAGRAWLQGKRCWSSLIRTKIKRCLIGSVFPGFGLATWPSDASEMPYTFPEGAAKCTVVCSGAEGRPRSMIAWV